MTADCKGVRDIYIINIGDGVSRKDQKQPHKSIVPVVQSWTEIGKEVRQGISSKKVNTLLLFISR